MRNKLSFIVATSALLLIFNLGTTAFAQCYEVLYQKNKKSTPVSLFQGSKSECNNFINKKTRELYEKGKQKTNYGDNLKNSLNASYNENLLSEIKSSFHLKEITCNENQTSNKNATEQTSQSQYQTPNDNTYTELGQQTNETIDNLAQRGKENKANLESNPTFQKNAPQETGNRPPETTNTPSRPKQTIPTTTCGCETYLKPNIYQDLANDWIKSPYSFEDKYHKICKTPCTDGHDVKAFCDNLKTHILIEIKKIRNNYACIDAEDMPDLNKANAVPYSWVKISKGDIPYKQEIICGYNLFQSSWDPNIYVISFYPHILKNEDLKQSDSKKKTALSLAFQNIIKENIPENDNITLYLTTATIKLPEAFLIEQSILKATSKKRILVKEYYPDSNQGFMYNRMENIKKIYGINDIHIFRKKIDALESLLQKQEQEKKDIND